MSSEYALRHVPHIRGLTMFATTIVLTCLVCPGDGRRFQTTKSRVFVRQTGRLGKSKLSNIESSVQRDRYTTVPCTQTSLRALGLLTLTTLNPAVQRGQPSIRNIRASVNRRSPVLRRHDAAVMASFDDKPLPQNVRDCGNVANNLPPIPPLLANRSNAAAVWRVAWPAVVIGLLRTALSQVDAWYIGRIGTKELEAISAATFAIWLVYLSGELPALSVQSLSSASEGAGDRADGVGSAVVQGLWWSLVASVVSAIVALQPGLLRSYFAFVGLHDEVAVAAGVAYARATFLWGALPLAASNVASAGFKGIGETVPALWIAAGTVLLNSLLNGPFIARWGVAGAAYATNLAVALSCIVSMRKLSRLGVRLRIVRPSLKVFRRIASIGTPVASSGVLFTLVYMMLSRTITSLSPLYVAALGIGHRIEAIAYTVCEGFGIGSSAVVGQWAGSGRSADARKSAGAAVRVAAAIMVPIGVLLWFGSAWAAQLFAKDAQVVSAAASYLKIVSFVFPLMALDHVYEGALVGVQQTLPVLVVTIIFTLARIPLARWLSGFWGVEGVWAAIAITTALRAPASWACFRMASMDNLNVSSKGTDNEQLSS